MCMGFGWKCVRSSANTQHPTATHVSRQIKKRSLKTSALILSDVMCDFAQNP